MNLPLLYDSNVDRFCGAFNLAGPSSLRSSSSQVFGIFGSNAQNQPPEFRRCLVPDPGCIFIEVDQASAESRIVAYECRRGVYQEVFENNLNAHAFLASHLFPHQTDLPLSCYEKSPTELAKLDEWWIYQKHLKKHHKKYYGLSKSSGHGYSYKMGWRTYQINVLTITNGEIILDADESKRQLLGVAVTLPEIAENHAQIEATVIATGLLHNIFGHPRAFVQRLNDEAIRQAVNFIPQSSVGLITHMAAIKFADGSKDTWHLLDSVHDSLLIQAPISEADEAEKFLCECMRMDLTSTTGNTYVMEVEATRMAEYWTKE